MFKTKFGFKNWSGSVESKNIVVYEPKNKIELQDFVTINNLSETRMHLRPFSAGHAYSNVLLSNNTILIDLTKMNNVIRCSVAENTIEVEPGIQMQDLLLYLEKCRRTIYNMPGCLNLSIGGCISAASHGSGIKATVAESVKQMEVLKSDGSIVTLTNIDPDFIGFVGCMGAMGIAISITLHLIPIQIYQDTLLVFDSAIKVQKHGYVGHSQFFWVPIENKFLYFNRAPLPLTSTQKTNKQSLLGKIEEKFEGIGGKALNSFRSTFNILSSKRTFSLLSNIFENSLRQLPNKNSLFELTLPLSREAVGLQPYFELSEDCEIFVPAPYFIESFQLFNEFYDFILNGKTTDQDIVMHLALKYKKMDEIKECALPETLFSSPVLCRFVPSTSLSIMAPNYQQDMWAISFPWYGSKKNVIKYKNAMNILIEMCVGEFGAKVHLGKYHNVAIVPQLKRRYEIKKMRKIISKWDPKKIFTNDFIASWFY